RHSGRRRACYSRGPLRVRCGPSGTAGWEGDDGPTGGPREALENVERRFLAWWSGGDEQTGLDGNWRDPRDAARRIGGGDGCRPRVGGRRGATGGAGGDARHVRGGRGGLSDRPVPRSGRRADGPALDDPRSEEHTSELQSR